MSKIVSRTIDFLELFANQKRPLSLSEISRLLEIPASSCHDVLHELQHRGYIYELAPRAGYYPTRRLLDIARTITENDPVTLRAEFMLRSLCDNLDESVLLAKVSGLQANYLLAFDSSHPLRFKANVGDNVRSLYATSAGKALLASLDDDALTACLTELVLKPLTTNTITSKTALRRDIKAGRQNGWFLNREESLQGVVTLSVPFKWENYTYIVTIAGPTSRIEPRLRTMTELLKHACQKLEMQDGTA